MKGILHCELINAFTAQNKPLGISPVGNPVAVCTGECFPTETLMSRISKKLSKPIISFLDFKKIKEGECGIRYYSLNGEEVNICGHGTLGAMKAIDDICKTEELKKIYFRPNYENYPKLLKKQITGVKGVDEYSIILPKLPKEKIENKQTIMDVASALCTSSENILEMYFGSTDDYIVVFKNINEFRRLEPDNKKILALTKGDFYVRAIMVTCQSDQEDFDFETRVFAPSIGCDEDIACGSANCSVAHMWSEKLSKQSMKMFYPYKAILEHKVGGVQKIHIIDDKYVRITSQASLQKCFDIVYDTEKNQFEIIEK